MRDIIVPSVKVAMLTKPTYSVGHGLGAPGNIQEIGRGRYYAYSLCARNDKKEATIYALRTEQ